MPVVQRIFPNEFGELLCTTCFQYKKETEFYKNKKHTSRGFDYQCKICKLKQHKEERINNNNRKNIERKSVLKRKYGLSKKDHFNLRDKQDYACAICHLDEEMFDRELSVDHNHKTNKKRGLLCQNCNSLLGMAKDSIEILESAIQYLKEND